ncbi:MAG TPA: DUF503 domain-containing protein [Candidatus Nitrosotenuis sp.]|jgi:uncharacterized protein YlxP (DUF503 family)|nr:DUF503 domain-containing protein [Candidatus Nitrosotenuis sp.]
MWLGVGRFELHLLTRPASLKEKRALVRRLRDRIRSRCQMAAAEVEDQDLYHRAVLGVSCVSSQEGHARQMLQSAAALIASEPEVEILFEDLDVSRWK